MNHRSIVFGTTALASAVLVVLLETLPQGTLKILPAAPILAVLTIYNLCVLAGGTRTLRSVLSTRRGLFACACLGAILFFSCIPVNDFTAYLSGSPHPFHGIPWLHATLAGTLFLISFANFLLATQESVLDTSAGALRKLWTMPTAWFLSAASLWVFAVTNLLSLAAFEHIPHVQDSISQLFQARVFARGALTAPLPHVVEFFQHTFDNMVVTDRWFSMYPPGHSFLLMFGVLLHMPWVINPLLAALSVIVLYKCAALCCAEQEARLGTMLFCVSPFVLFMSSSFMNHVSTLLFFLLSLYGLALTIKKKRPLHALLGGLALGMVATIRPHDALACGFVTGGILGIWSLRVKTFRPMVCFVIGAAIPTAGVLLYNRATTGHPLLFGYQVHYGPGHTFGFYRTKWGLPVYTPLEAVKHVLSNLFALNKNLLEWPLPALALPALLWTPFLLKKDRVDLMLTAGALAFPVLYFFFFFQDLCLGPRFYYCSVPFVLLLGARAAYRLVPVIAKAHACPERRVRHLMGLLFLTCVLFAGGLRMPQLFRFYSDSFWQVDNALYRAVQAENIENAIVFMKSTEKILADSDLGSGFLHNDPWLTKSVIFARDLGSRNAELAAAYPGRRTYLARRNAQEKIIIEPLHLRGTPAGTSGGGSP